jgi:hypothetical protein
VWLVVAAGALAACSAVGPVKVQSGDQCVRCRRIIQEPKVAAEIVNTGGLIEKFRGPGCMAKYLATAPTGQADIYVTDYVSGKLINANGASYVPVLLDRYTGETDYRAYKLRADAVAASQELGAVIFDWSAVLAKAR